MRTSISAIERSGCALLCLSIVLCAKAAFADPGCSVKASVPPTARTFARTDDQSAWHEFQTMKQVPELGDGGMSGQFWRDNDGNSSAYTVEPGEDFWTYARYCFDGAGELHEVGFEVRTAWDWGYRIDGTILNGQLRIRSAHFFSTANEEPIKRPTGADDIPNALKPSLYLTVRTLPFGNLLNPRSRLAR